MAQIITATFQNGAFVPDQPVDVVAGTRAKVVLEEAVTSTEQSSTIVRDYLLPQGEAIAQLQELCEKSPIHSGLRMTRDELHERD